MIRQSDRTGPVESKVRWERPEGTGPGASSKPTALEARSCGGSRLIQAMTPEIQALLADLEREGYVAEPQIATAAYLAREMRKPLLVEGDAGVGKTELAKVLARLPAPSSSASSATKGSTCRRRSTNGTTRASSCACGWRKRKEARTRRHRGARLQPRLPPRAAAPARDHARAPARPAHRRDRPRRRRVRGLPARAALGLPGHDPGARHDQGHGPPYVVLTSNRTRELGDALRRRCLYLYIEHPISRRRCASSARAGRRRASGWRARSAASCGRCARATGEAARRRGDARLDAGAREPPPGRAPRGRGDADARVPAEGPCGPADRDGQRGDRAPALAREEGA